MVGNYPKSGDIQLRLLLVYFIGRMTATAKAARFGYEGN
jgi:hypothetical protein